MLVSVSEVKNQFSDLVKCAQAGDDVIFTQRGRQVARLVAVAPVPDAQERWAVMERVRAAAASKVRPGADAAHSQDFLYDDDGLPI